MAATATGVYHRTYAGDLALRHTRAEHVRLALAIALVIAAPYLVSPTWLTVLDQIGIAVIGAIGLNLLVGSTGQISLGQGGFLAVGAYTAGILTARADMPFLVGIVAAVVLTASVGALFGLPALRLKGLYLAIATLAAQQVIIWVVTHWDAVTGGVDALVVPAPSLFGIDVSGDFNFYWVILAFAALSTIAATNLLRTGIGRAFVAIRDQDIAADVAGVNLTRYKVLAFAVSSGFVGLAGALTAYHTGIVTWERFTLDVSILYLAMIIVGGLGRVSGAIYGAAFMIAMPAYLELELASFGGPLEFIGSDLPAVQELIFGLTIVLFLVFEPRGIARIWDRTKDYFRLWPFRT
jgi:branched-chain amino acid transport system permease protein